jgi:hypothetical protein
MPELIPTNKFLDDAERFRRRTAIRKKIAKAMRLLEANPHHPGLHLERIANDPSAWSVRVDRSYRISLEPESCLEAGNPDWNAPVVLLRILDHDDLYKSPR